MKNKIEGNKNINFYEIAKSFSLNDLNEVINFLTKEDLGKQEYEQLIKNYGEYFDIFGKEFEKSLAFSIFEYQLIKIYTLDRDDSNMKEKILFHD